MSEDKTPISTTKAYVVFSNQVFPIRKPVVTIGRNLDNDLVIQNAQVSRVHAEIHCNKDGFQVIDRGSASGTFVNNVKIEESTVYSGDLILIANIPLMILDDKDPMLQDMEKRTDKLKKKGK